MRFHGILSSVVLVLATAAQAAVVSWNYDRYGTVSGTRVAGVEAVANWNNSYPSDPTVDLIDDSGATTTLDISYASYNTWTVNEPSPANPGQDADGTYNRELLNGYLSAGPAAWNPSITDSQVVISQIPYTTYDIIVYFSSDGAGREGDVTAGSTTYSFKTIGPTSVSGSNAVLTPTTDSAGTYTTTANYAVFSGLSGTTQTVRVQMRDNDEWGGIAGFQVVESAADPNDPNLPTDPNLPVDPNLPAFADWAPTPPMGWNSWDCYGSSVTEDEVRDNADYMAANLLPFGWEYIVVDIRWYVSNPATPPYNHWNPIYNLDANGRILPAPNRFPSADDGNGGNLGFKPLADYVHSLGLKFGVHMMRGINQEAWDNDLPIANSSYTTQDIVRNIWDSGSLDIGAAWLHDSYGMDKTDAAQAYYDSLFALYAEWGVDYLKVDDMLRDYSHPNDSYYADEIEMIRAAIDNSGREMLLSLSPGAAPLAQAQHLSDHANLWRITNDLWDEWGDVYNMFDRAYEWTPYRGDGRWPDNDMLPLGRIAIRGERGGERMSNLTQNEQLTLMTLWSISRSPLMFGGDLPSNDTFTLSLLTNPEVLEVNQHSSNNRQISRVGDTVVWAADAPDRGQYLSAFNAGDVSGGFASLLSQASYVSNLITVDTRGRSTSIDVDITGKPHLYLLVDVGDGDGPDPDVYDYDWADWVNMELTGPNVPTLMLTDLAWTYATSGWAGPTINLNNEGSGPLIINGVTYANGIGTHAESIIQYELPDGYTQLTGMAGLDDGGASQSGATSSVRFAVTALEELTDAVSVNIAFADLGLTGTVLVRDLWSQADLGLFETSFSTSLLPHASALYYLAEVDPFDFDNDGDVDDVDMNVFLLALSGPDVTTPPAGVSSDDFQRADNDDDGDVDLIDAQAFANHFTG